MKVTQQHRTPRATKAQSLPKTPNKEIMELSAALDRIDSSDSAAKSEFSIKPNKVPIDKIVTGTVLGAAAAWTSHFLVSHLAPHSALLGGASGAFVGIALVMAATDLVNKRVDIPRFMDPILLVLGSAGGIAAGVALASAGLSAVATAAAAAIVLGVGGVSNGDGV